MVQFHPLPLAQTCNKNEQEKEKTQMKRKLKRFWKEWGITLEEVKAILTILTIFASLYILYILAWAFS